MAKKKRPTAAQDAQRGMNTLMRTMSRLVEKPPPNVYDMADNIATATDHITDALEKRGIQCICELHIKRGRYVWPCKCRRKRKGFPNLSGTHCRDAQGRFVPVGQCRGPVGRDPKTGRFISLLKAEMKR